jgi:hypothetical protein
VPHVELRADALLAILAAPDQQTLQAVAAQATSLRDRPARARVRLATLRAALTTAPDLAATLFDEALADLATGPRHALLDQYPLLLEITARSAPAEAARTIAEDLRDVQRWWP